MGGSDVMSALLPKSVVNVTDYGANNGVPNHLAFAAAIHATNPGLDPDYRGGVVIVPAGLYEFDAPLVIDRSIRLVAEGAGGYGPMSNCELRFKYGGIVIARDTSAGEVPVWKRPRGDYSIIEGFKIRSYASNNEGHGVDIKAPCMIRECLVEGFPGNGFNIVAQAPTTNANFWTVIDCTVRGNEHGFYVQGPDVNHGSAERCDVTGNRGVGVYDLSFLGCDWYRVHCAFNGGGDFKTANPNTRSTFNNCYSESGNNFPNDIRRPCTIIGGQLDNAGDAVRLTVDFQGGVMSPMRVRNGDVSLRAGSTALRSVLEMERVARPLPYRITHDHIGNAPGWWGLVFGGLGNGAALRWCDDTTAEWSRGVPGAKTWMERGAVLGPQRAIVTTAPTEPTTGDWRVGDVVLCSVPTSTLDGWRRCDDGNGAYWRPFVWSSPP